LGLISPEMLFTLKPTNDSPSEQGQEVKELSDEFPTPCLAKTHDVSDPVSRKYGLSKTAKFCLADVYIFTFNLRHFLYVTTRDLATSSTVLQPWLVIWARENTRLYVTSGYLATCRTRSRQTCLAKTQDVSDMCLRKDSLKKSFRVHR